MRLTLDSIKSKQDRPREFVPVPEWTPDGETFDPTKDGVYVSSMSRRHRDSYELELMRRKGTDEQENLKNLRALICVLAVENEDGTRMFTLSDIDWLTNKSAAALGRIFDAAAKLNRLQQADVEELTKN